MAFESIQYRFLIGIISCLLIACTASPRREEYVSEGGARVIAVRAPILKDEESPRLVHLRDITGENFPFDPPIVDLGEVVADEHGRLFITDRGRGHVIVSDISGRFLGTIGREGPGPFEFFQSGAHPSDLAWNLHHQALAVQDLYKIILFNADGEPFPNRIQRRGAWGVESLGDNFICLQPDMNIFHVYSIDGEDITGYGNVLGPESAGWKSVARYIQRLSDVTLPDGSMLPAFEKLPSTYGVAGDSLVVHDLSYRNGYRAWNHNTGQIEWELLLETEDYEPPTFYKYRTSGTGALISWSRLGRPDLVLRSRVQRVIWRDGWLFSVLYLTGDDTRIKPDRLSVENPSTRSKDLWEGIPSRGAIDIVSLEPDLIAHISFDIESGFFAEVAPGPILVLAMASMTPHLKLFRIEGLPQPTPAPN